MYNGQNECRCQRLRARCTQWIGIDCWHRDVLDIDPVPCFWIISFVFPTVLSATFISQRVGDHNITMCRTILRIVSQCIRWCMTAHANNTKTSILNFTTRRPNYDTVPSSSNAVHINALRARPHTKISQCLIFNVSISSDQIIILLYCILLLYCKDVVDSNAATIARRLQHALFAFTRY